MHLESRKRRGKAKAQDDLCVHDLGKIPSVTINYVQVARLTFNARPAGAMGDAVASLAGKEPSVGPFSKDDRFGLIELGESDTKSTRGESAEEG